METQALIELDIKFCQDVQYGKAKSWSSYFHDCGILVTNSKLGLIKGPRRIYDYMYDVFNLPSFELTWEPLNAEISSSNDLGYTYGRYTRKYLIDGKTKTDNGFYTTIWKKNENNEWKIIHDIGT